MREAIAHNPRPLSSWHAHHHIPLSHLASSMVIHINQCSFMFVDEKVASTPSRSGCVAYVALCSFCVALCGICIGLWRGCVALCSFPVRVLAKLCFSPFLFNLHPLPLYPTPKDSVKLCETSVKLFCNGFQNNILSLHRDRYATHFSILPAPPQSYFINRPAPGARPFDYAALFTST
jgi:hypothetical protein